LLAEEDRAAALTALRQDARATAAGLVYAVLQPAWLGAGGREQLFSWQPSLVPALEWGVLDFDEDAAGLAARLTGRFVTVAELRSRLAWAARFIDDAHWCMVLQRELDLQRIAIKTEGIHSQFDITLEMEGLAVGLQDPRLVSLVERALEYRRCRSAIVRFPEGVLSVKLGRFAYARLGRRDFVSEEPVTDALLGRMAAAGAGWSSVLAEEARAAS
jgi:hypothetical protein